VIEDLSSPVSRNLEITGWLGKDEFNRIKDSSGIHYILFAAKWCGFCSRFLEQARSVKADRLVLTLVDTDDPDESLWDEYSVRAVPTLLVFKDGKSVFRRDARLGAGLRPSELEQALNEFPAQA
jgi:thioredoxin 1